MNKIARFTLRGDGSQNDGFGLFIALKNQQMFKAGRVYEIRDVLGTTVIVDVGTCALRNDNSEHHKLNLGVSWANTVDCIINEAKANIFISEEEIENKVKVDGYI